MIGRTTGRSSLIGRTTGRSSVIGRTTGRILFSLYNIYVATQYKIYKTGLYLYLLNLNKSFITKISTSFGKYIIVLAPRYTYFFYKNAYDFFQFSQNNFVLTILQHDLSF